MRREVRQHFRALRMTRAGLPDLPPTAPLIIYSNHPSWWDPAIYIVLAKALFPGRLGFGPMDAEALDRYRFMRRIGIFGVEPGTRAGAARFLRTGVDVLADPNRRPDPPPRHSWGGHGVRVSRWGVYETPIEVHRLSGRLIAVY